jgi:hypothetical protein
MDRSSRWFTLSLLQRDFENQFHFFLTRRRCGFVYDELRTQLASVFPRWIVLLFVDAIPATQFASVLSRSTPLNDLRSDALFLFPRLPACVLWPYRLCDFVFLPDFMCFSSA